MNPIGASQSFPLATDGRFERRELKKPAEATKLVIAPKGPEEAAKLAITPSAKAALAITPTGAHAPLAAGSTPASATPSTTSTKSDQQKPKIDPNLEKVAHEFEAIFLRNLLKPLEEAGTMGKQGGSVSSGSSVYGGMMVGALADSASQGGGIGLAHLVLEALTRGATPAKIDK